VVVGDVVAVVCAAELFLAAEIIAPFSFDVTNVSTALIMCFISRPYHLLIIEE
jgi:hypothetical protein